MSVSLRKLHAGSLVIIAMSWVTGLFVILPHLALLFITLPEAAQDCNSQEMMQGLETPIKQPALL